MSAIDFNGLDTAVHGPIRLGVLTALATDGATDASETPSVRARFSPKLAATLSVSRDQVHAGGASFGTTLASVRIDGSFSTRMFLNAFLQYNSVTRQLSSNVRYDFIHHPLSDLYIVYNDTRAVGGPPQRTIAVKHTLMLSF